MRIQESLEVSRNVTSNYYFLSAIELAKVNVIAGTSWITPFEEKSYLNQWYLNGRSRNANRIINNDGKSK